MVVAKRTPDNGEENALALAYVQLQQQFVAGLVRRQAELIQAQNPSARLAALHRLAGAAGSFGFVALGLLARQAMLIEDMKHSQEKKLRSRHEIDKVLTDALLKIYLEINRLSQQSPIDSADKRQ